MTTVEIRLEVMGGARIKRWRETYATEAEAMWRRCRLFRAYRAGLHSVWVYPTHKGV